MELNERGKKDEMEKNYVAVMDSWKSNGKLCCCFDGDQMFADFYERPSTSVQCTYAIYAFAFISSLSTTFYKMRQFGLCMLFELR